MKNKINEAVNKLKSEIPNMNEFYDDSIISEIVQRILENGISKRGIAEDFIGELIEMDEPVRRCTMCGKLMSEGYLLGDYYACSDKCKHDHYKTLYNAKDDEEAEKFYFLECYEIGDIESGLVGYFTDNDKNKYQTNLKPSQMSLSELQKFIEEHNLPIGDYVFYTAWL